MQSQQIGYNENEGYNILYDIGNQTPYHIQQSENDENIFKPKKTAKHKLNVIEVFDKRKKRRIDPQDVQVSKKRAHEIEIIATETNNKKRNITEKENPYSNPFINTVNLQEDKCLISFIRLLKVSEKEHITQLALPLFANYQIENLDKFCIMRFIQITNRENREDVVKNFIIPVLPFLKIKGLWQKIFDFSGLVVGVRFTGLAEGSDKLDVVKQAVQIFDSNMTKTEIWSILNTINKIDKAARSDVIKETHLRFREGMPNEQKLDILSDVIKDLELIAGFSRCAL